MSRVMLRLHKGDEVKYLSHLDLMRAFEFALRRARVPVAFSEGFNPRPKMSLGSAVGVGVTSDDERIVVDLASDMSADEVMSRLNDSLPPGLRILGAELLPEGVKSPIGTLNGSRFRLEFSCGDGCDCSAVQSAVEDIMDSAEIRVTRVSEKKGTREVDIRPRLVSAEVAQCAGHSVAVDIAVKMGESGGVRPQDFVQALGNRLANISVIRIHRLEQFRAAD